MGKVPYPLLHLFASNQTYTFDPQRFTLINNYQYAADSYLSMQAIWDGKGAFFNLIPGIRHLRLRELAEIKVAWGSLRDTHRSVVDSPTLSSQEISQSYQLLTAPTIPHIEMGVGIGNILRVGEVYSIWRLTHINDPATPYWTIRFRLSLGL